MTCRVPAALALTLTALLGAACSANDSGSPQASPHDSFPVGAHAPFTVYAHCGVDSATIDGENLAHQASR